MNQRIKELLKKPEWTYKRLANEIGVSVGAVNSWISTNERDRRNPNKWILPKLNNILDRENV